MRDDEMDWLWAVMANCREARANSGLSDQDIGERMGYSTASARKSVGQFLNRTFDPRLSMLRRFCRAVDADIKEILGG